MNYSQIMNKIFEIYKLNVGLVMTSIKFSDNKSEIVLKVKKKFKGNYIQIIVDNCANDNTLDYDAEAILTMGEAKELIKELQKIIDLNESI